MNVLSLFDGISSGQVALKRAGIKVNTYFASEIDKNAIKVTQHNFPSTIQLGDVVTVDPKKLPRIDIILAGSPCQGFSRCGKRKNFNNNRSCLYFEFIRLLRELKPRYWLLENVKVNNAVHERISSELGVQPLEINSALVSAQTRIRLYWTNIPHATIPEDRGILLGHVIEHPNNKRYTNNKGYVYPKTQIQASNNNRLSIRLNNSSLRREIQKALGDSKYIDTFLWRFDKFGRIVVMDPKKHKIQRVGSIAFMDNKTELITCMTQPHMIGRDHKVRKLTPDECDELQTLPRGYTNILSKTARYKALGNGWTVEVISHLLSGIPKNNNKRRNNRTPNRRQNT